MNRKYLAVSFVALFFVLTVIFSPQAQTTQAGETVLGNLAVSMSSGTWVQLTTNNFNDGAVLHPVVGTGCGSGLEYMDEAHWNPINSTVMILGGSHPSGGIGCTNTTVFAKYTESSNTWMNTLPNPSPNYDSAFIIASGGIDSLGHGYHHQAIVAATGAFMNYPWRLAIVLARHGYSAQAR